MSDNADTPPDDLRAKYDRVCSWLNSGEGIVITEPPTDIAPSPQKSPAGPEETVTIDTVGQAEELAARQARGEILITNIQFPGSTSGEFPISKITITVTEDPGPVRVPPSFDADVANSLYGDRYGIDWEYLG